MHRTITNVVAGLVVLSVHGAWLAMEWTGREPDSIIMLGGVAISIGAAYHLWDGSMDSGVEAVGELQGEEGGEE